MDINDLKQYNEIIVIGHKTLDVDTILSSMLLCNIFKSFGINAKYATIGMETINTKNKKMICDFNYNPLIINKNDINNHKYFLVDHNDVIQSVGNKDLVIGFIDHHMGKKYNDQCFFTNRSSTTLGIFEKFKGIYEFSDIEKRMVLMGFLDDTRFGIIRTIDDEDIKLIGLIEKNINFDDYKKNYFEEDDISDMDYAFSNTKLKEYSLDGFCFKSTAIERLGINYLNNYKNFIYQSNDIFGMWLDYQNNKTYVFINYHHNNKELFYDKLVSRSEVVLGDVLNYIRSLYE